MKLLKYFSAPERARRARQRERFNLAAELREITVSRRYYDAREPRIVARVAELDALDRNPWEVRLRGNCRSVLPTSRIIEDDAKLQEGAGIAFNNGPAVFDARGQLYPFGLRGIK